MTGNLRRGSIMHARQSIARIAVVASMAVVIVAPVARAGEPRNAAVWYRRAIDQLDRISSADWERLESWDGARTAPTAEVRSIMTKAGPMLDLFRRGSLEGTSDFGLDWTQGFELAMPHLGQLRSIAKLTSVDAQIRLADGDAAGAADRIASLYRSAAHAGDDGILISSLVGSAIFSLADDLAGSGFDRAQFGPAEAEIMLAPLRGYDASDPMKMIDALAGERWSVVEWLGERFGAQADRQQLVAEMGWLMDEEGDAAQLAAMTDEEFAADVARYDAMMDRVVEAFTTEPRDAGRAALDALAKELESDQHGLLAKVLTPALAVIFDRMWAVRDKVAQRRALLEDIARGAIDPAEEANAAILYASAVERMHEIAPAERDRMRAFERFSDVRPDPPTAKALGDAAPVFDLLREGASKKRCDFRILRPRGAAPLCPPEIAGLHEALALLRAEARLRAAAGDVAGAAAALSVEMRVVAHIGGDEPLLSAAVAHHALQRIVPVLEPLASATGFTDEHRATLAAAARAIGRRDPFGYVEGMMKARASMTAWLHGRLQAVDPAIPRAAVEPIVKAWDGDRILHLLLVLDTMERTAREESAAENAPAPGAPDAAHEGAGDPLMLLDGIVDASTVAPVRDDVARVAPLLAHGDADALSAHPVVAFAGYETRRRTARGDVRGVLALLRAEATEDEEGR
jgi:hypothetical protein